MPLNLGDLNNNFNNSQPTSGLTSLNLKKGMSLDLAKHANLKNVRFGLGWKAGNGENFDLDATAILLNSRGVVNDAQDVIFYNQLDTNRGVKSLGDNKVGSYNNVGATDDETIIVDTTKVPSSTQEILFVVTIYDAVRRNQNFGMVKEAYIKVYNDDSGEELARYSLDEKYSLQISCEVAKLVKTAYGWEFIPVDNRRNDNLEQILISYGVS